MNKELIIFSIIISSFTQILLKPGMDMVGKINLSFTGLLSVYKELIFNIYVIPGILSFCLGLVLWLIVLLKKQCRLCLPFCKPRVYDNNTNQIFSFNESVSVTRIIGLSIIIVGILIL